MKFEKVGQELYNYFTGNKWFKILLPLDVGIVYVIAVMQLLQQFISLGGLINSLIGYIFYLGLLLAISKANYRATAIGLGARAVAGCISFIESLIRYRDLSYGGLLALVIYGFFTYMAYKKYLQLNR